MLPRIYCVFVLSLAPALAQPLIPDTPAGRVFRARLDAFNSGDQKRISTFYQQYQPEQSAENTISFRANTGGFDLLTIEQSEPLHLDVQVKERNRGLTAIGLRCFLVGPQQELQQTQGSFGRKRRQP